MGKKITEMTPAELVAEGARLIKLARAKEVELKQKMTVELGQVMARELSGKWSTPWEKLSAELEKITGEKVARPVWSEDTIPAGDVEVEGAAAGIIETQSEA